MSAIYGLYADPDAAQRAVNGLYAAGVDQDNVVVMSGEPFEAQPFAHRDSATWLWYIACAGGLFGLLGSTWLTRMTELAWPLKTGNMPIVAWWPNMIVMFEMTMSSSRAPSTVSNASPPQPSNKQLEIEILTNPPLDSVPHLMRPVPPMGRRLKVPSSSVPNSQQPVT